MPTTANGIRYPAPTDAPNGPQQIGDLAADVDALLDPLIDQPWTDYTPVWTASGTNPVINSLGKISGRYQRTGSRIEVCGRISMGANTTYGSGIWNVSLPVTARWPSDVQLRLLYPGAGWAFDNSDTTHRYGIVPLLTDADTIFFANADAAGNITSTVPFTWATSDALHWSLVYEAA